MASIKRQPGNQLERNTGMIEMENIANIDDHRPHIVAKALCLNMVCGGFHPMPCLTQWIATCPAETPLTKLECPECGAQNSFAVEIGQRIAEKKPMIGEEHED